MYATTSNNSFHAAKKARSHAKKGFGMTVAPSLFGFLVAGAPMRVDELKYVLMTSNMASYLKGVRSEVLADRRLDSR